LHWRLLLLGCDTMYSGRNIPLQRFLPLPSSGWKNVPWWWSQQASVNHFILCHIPKAKNLHAHHCENLTYHC
jgi:hypothetical protein